MVHIIQQRQIMPHLQNDYLFALSPLKKEYDRALSIMRGFTKKVIREKRVQFEENMANNNQTGPIAFLDLLLQAVLPDGSRLNDSDIQEEVDTFMFEGHDTTACAISWSLYLLGKNPQIMDKVVAEQKEIFKENTFSQVTQTDLTKMKYLECCIKEALRLYPSVPIIGRKCEKDCFIDGEFVEKGVSVMVFVHLLHRNPEIWPNPEEFIPERFLEATKRNPYAYVPFSAGPRNCIGQRFAMMELKTVLSHLLRQLDFTSMDKKIKPIVEVITRPFNGVNSKITAR